MKLRAQIIQDVGDWQRDRIRLALREERFDGDRYLLSDGSWTDPPVQRYEIPAVAEGLEIGLALPAGSLEAIDEAIGLFRGTAMTHAATEASVLRESLDVERARVDRALERRAEWILLDENGIRKMSGGGLE